MASIKTISMSAQSNTVKFHNKLDGRFVLTPLSFWKDGSTTSEDTGQEWITVNICTLRCVKGQSKPFFSRGNTTIMI